ncbi:MAG: GAF domain-containing protein, partial [Turicibacter sp.]|nr:GAF domain-containing protein [Turicibacter sp.]
MAEQYPIGKNREENYNYMVATAKAFIQGEKNLVANLSNLSSIINLYVDTINWAGFYLMEEGELVLGPFQGKPACIRIPLGKGVCGTAAAEGRTIIVEDV